VRSGTWANGINAVERRELICTSLPDALKYKDQVLVMFQDASHVLFCVIS